MLWGVALKDEGVVILGIWCFRDSGSADKKGEMQTGFRVQRVLA